MDNSAKFEAEVLDLLSQLKDKKQKIQARFEAELAAVDRDIESVSTTARLLRQRGGDHSPSYTPSLGYILGVSPRDLAGKSVREACIEIAKANGGLVRVKDAKDLLLAAGVVKKGKYMWGVVNTTLIRAKEFEKHPTEHGAYRLMEFTPKQGQLVA
jgi:hypothetical protein